MLYRVLQTIGSSMFACYADRRLPLLTSQRRVTRPVGLALFPQDLGSIPPRRFAERMLAVSRWTPMPCDGHFAAMEAPELLAQDLRAFFRPLR